MIDLSIRTQRLSLRPFVATDAPRVRELCGAWAVSRMLARVPFPYPPGLAEHWISSHDTLRCEGRSFPFAITLHNRLIGCVDVFEEKNQGRFTLGYWIGAPYWGFGYATEAGNAALGFAFGWLGLAALSAQHYEDNPSSARVLAKLGFVETGRSLHPCLARKANVPGVDLELTRDSWRAKQV